MNLNGIEKLSEQPVTMLICVIGIINGILSIIHFLRQKPREVGCGLYLYASSTIFLIAKKNFDK
jgi:hypothetical protein